MVMDGVKYGWKKFTENVGPFLIAGLIWFVVIGLVFGILYAALVAGAVAADQAANDGGVAFGLGFGFGTFLLLAITALLSAFAQAAFLNAALRVAAGQKLELTHFFKLPNTGAAIGAAVVVVAATGIRPKFYDTFQAHGVNIGAAVFAPTRVAAE
jgi:hypothetical protein